MERSRWLIEFRFDSIFRFRLVHLADGVSGYEDIKGAETDAIDYRQSGVWIESNLIFINFLIVVSVLFAGISSEGFYKIACLLHVRRVEHL